MTDIIIIAVVLIIVALAAGYVIRAKKRGRRCIGCPEGHCPGNCACCSACSSAAAPDDE